MKIGEIIIWLLVNLPRRLEIEFYRFWNQFLFLAKGVKFGHKLNVTSSVYVHKSINSKIIIGDNFKFTSGKYINPLCRNIRGCLIAYPNAKIIIGDNVGMSSPCIWANTEIRIGNNVKIGGDTILMDTDAHSLDYNQRRDRVLDVQNKKEIPIHIDDDVLIGARCIVLKGVTIGARTIIGSGSVVTKSIPSDCIAAGNPCRVIKYLNS